MFLWYTLMTNWVYEITRGRVRDEIPPRIGSGEYGRLEGTLSGQSPAPPPMSISSGAQVGGNSPSQRWIKKSVVNWCRIKENFLELEELSVSQPKRCGTCRHCTRCSMRSMEMTVREAAELAKIEENITYDQEERKVTFVYPNIKDTRKLEDNYDQALAIERKVEAKLVKSRKIDLFNAEVAGYIQRGAFRELHSEELKAWKGSRNYISIHDVPKPSSLSTVLRVVSNSSLNNNNRGISYNDCLPKGPCALVPLLEAMVTWRMYPSVCCWDYSKCYNTVWTLTTLPELHCHRFIWRFNQTEEWRVFGIDRMHFGDRPAAIGLEVAKNLVAESGRDIDSAAVDMIKRDYIDDGFGGGSEEDVDRLMGEVEDEDGKISFRGTVSQIMSQGNFRIKVMVRSGESRPAVLKDYGGTILGIPWETKEDKIKMKFEVNLSQKVQKI